MNYKGNPIEFLWRRRDERLQMLSIVTFPTLSGTHRLAGPALSQTGFKGPDAVAFTRVTAVYAAA